VAVWGEADLACGLAAWLAETGAKPVLVASGAEGGALTSALRAQIPGFDGQVLEGADFEGIGEAARAAGAELLIPKSELPEPEQEYLMRRELVSEYPAPRQPARPQT